MVCMGLNITTKNEVETSSYENELKFDHGLIMADYSLLWLDHRWLPPGWVGFNPDLDSDP